MKLPAQGMVGLRTSLSLGLLHATFTIAGNETKKLVFTNIISDVVTHIPVSYEL